MRKSIFLTTILALFGVAIMYGQATKGSDPKPLSGTNCQDSPLKPIAGKNYTYGVTVNPTGGNFQWWATKDPNFIKTTGSTTTNNRATALTNTTGLMANSSNYNQASSTGDTVSITWGTDLLAGTTTASPTFVVVQYDAPTANCSNNLKVYKIEPINAFTVDIKNMTNSNTAMAGYGAGSVHSACVSEIKGATYSSTANKMVYDYGTNELYFEVVAANFSNSYTPTFQLEGLQTGQTADIEWGYTKGSYANSLETGIAGGTTFSKESTVPVTTNLTNTNQGASIYVKVTVYHGTYESTSNQSIKLGVTGKNSANQSDVVNSDCGTTATFANDDSNIAEQQLKQRPEVTSNTGSGTFITQ